MQILKKKTAKLIFDALGSAYGEGLVSEEELCSLLAYPPDNSMGDLALPCFRLAKALRNSPVKIAETLAGAISCEEREALAYNEEAVNEAKKKAKAPLPCGCPGTMAKAIERKDGGDECAVQTPVFNPSRLRQWPVQIKLVAPNAPYFNGNHLLVAADCTAYAYGNFHNDFIKNKVCIIGCPKLDTVDYTDKLTAIIANNDIKSVTVVRMEVPCCGGIENAVKNALRNSGKFIPWQVVTISTDGRIVE